MRSWNTFGAHTNHEHTWTHMTHHGPDLGEVTTFPLIVLFMPTYEAYTQMSFCLGPPNLGIPKFPKLGLSQIWKHITFFVNLWLRWGLKFFYSPCQEHSNNMWHTTCTQVNQGNSQLIVVENQIGSLIPNPSFGHNLCFKYSNGTCKPVLNIYVLRVFHDKWYKKIFNPMIFDSCNHFLKIQESIGTLIPKVGTHLGLCGFIPSHPSTLPRAWNVTFELHFRHAPL
jgi:hypothetical protein